MGLHRMIPIFLPSHNITNYSLIHFPLQFCIPHCIANLFCHLEGLSSMIAALAASLGPWGTIPCGVKPFATCCSFARFPMDIGDSTSDHMRFGIAITLQHRLNLGRFDACRISHPNAPIIWYTTC